MEKQSRANRILENIRYYPDQTVPFTREKEWERAVKKAGLSITSHADLGWSWLPKHLRKALDHLGETKGEWDDEKRKGWLAKRAAAPQKPFWEM